MILIISYVVTMFASLSKLATTNPGTPVSREGAPDSTGAADAKATLDLTSNIIKENERHFYLRH
jgi:hypothetical protein